jgi:alanine dehydrogenase
MKIGIPKEKKRYEFRVGATPAFVQTLIEAGHEVLVERGAAAPIGFVDEMYQEKGAHIVPSAKEVFDADMIIKVKEPQAEEFSLLKEGQILFCYLHLAPDPVQTKELLEKKVVGIAYETVTDDKGRLPLLTPMSEVAGRLSIQVGMMALQMNNGGRGLLLSGVPGVAPGKVVVVGCGVAGGEAARIAIGLGADVTVIDKNMNRLREMDALYQGRVKTLYATSASIQESLKEADLVVGAVLIPGKLAPKVIKHEFLKSMNPGSVIVDISIDQGGCSETSRPTNHADPIYVVEGVIHYCVTNMPGACARTSTMALTNATLPYALEIANKGWKGALRESRHLKEGLNVCNGFVTNGGVAHDLNYPFTPPESFL